MSSVEPNDGFGELNSSEEVTLGLVVSSGDGQKLLEPGEKARDETPCLEQVAIIVAVPDDIPRPVISIVQ